MLFIIAFVIIIVAISIIVNIFISIIISIITIVIALPMEINVLDRPNSMPAIGLPLSCLISVFVPYVSVISYRNLDLCCKIFVMTSAGIQKIY